MKLRIPFLGTLFIFCILLNAQNNFLAAKAAKTVSPVETTGLSGGSAEYISLETDAGQLYTLYKNEQDQPTLKLFNGFVESV